MKKMKDLSSEELLQLRKEITLNSLFVSDYENSFGIPAREVCDFFDGYMGYLTELEREDTGKTDMDFKDFFEKYDTDDNLLEWYGCIEWE